MCSAPTCRAFSEEDLDISLTGNRLTVSGKREQEKHEQSDTYYARSARTAASAGRSRFPTAPTRENVAPT